MYPNQLKQIRRIPAKQHTFLKKWTKELRKIIFTTGRWCCVIGTHWGTAAGSGQMDKTFYRPNRKHMSGVVLAIQFGWRVCILCKFWLIHDYPKQFYWTQLYCFICYIYLKTLYVDVNDIKWKYLHFFKYAPLYEPIE